MKLAILKERRPGEARVAGTPETVKKLKSLGLEVTIEAGAGEKARIADNDYLAQGAVIAPDAASALNHADIVFKVRGPDSAEIANCRSI